MALAVGWLVVEEPPNWNGEAAAGAGAGAPPVFAPNWKGDTADATVVVEEPKVGAVAVLELVAPNVGRLDTVVVETAPAPNTKLAVVVVEEDSVVALLPNEKEGAGAAVPDPKVGAVTLVVTMALLIQLALVDLPKENIPVPETSLGPAVSPEVTVVLAPKVKGLTAAGAAAAAGPVPPVTLETGVEPAPKGSGLSVPVPTASSEEPPIPRLKLGLGMAALDVVTAPRPPELTELEARPKVKALGAVG